MVFNDQRNALLLYLMLLLSWYRSRYHRHCRCLIFPTSFFSTVCLMLRRHCFTSSSTSSRRQPLLYSLSRAIPEALYQKRCAECWLPISLKQCLNRRWQDVSSAAAETNSLCCFVLFLSAAQADAVYSSNSIRTCRRRRARLVVRLVRHFQLGLSLEPPAGRPGTAGQTEQC